MHTTQSIGTLLREARHRYGLTVEDIADALCIQKKNIEYLESNAFFRIPEKLYRELFLKTYSIHLGLDWEEIRAQYQREQNLYVAAPSAQKELPLRYHVRTSSLWITSKIIRNSFVTACICGGFLYIVYFGWQAFQAPELVIFQPQTEFSISGTEQIFVAGQTRKEAHVTINGQPVIKKQDGTFSQEIALRNGLNLITITVSKKFSRQESMTRRVIFEKDTEKYTFQYKDL